MVENRKRMILTAISLFAGKHKSLDRNRVHFRRKAERAMKIGFCVNGQEVFIRIRKGF